MEVAKDQHWNKFIGKIYYVLCRDDNRYFRSIRIAHNVFTNGPRVFISNPVMGVPTPEMEEMPQHTVERLLKHQTSYC